MVLPLILVLLLSSFALEPVKGQDRSLHIDVQCSTAGVYVSWRTNDSKLQHVYVVLKCDNSSNDQYKDLAETLESGLEFSYAYPLKRGEVCNITVYLLYEHEIDEITRNFQCSDIEESRSTMSSTFISTSFISTSSTAGSITDATLSSMELTISSSSTGSLSMVSDSLPFSDLSHFITSTIVPSSTVLNTTTGRGSGNNIALIMSISGISVVMTILLVVIFIIVYFILLIRCKKLKMSHNVHGIQDNFIYLDVDMMDDISLSESVITVEQPLAWDKFIATTITPDEQDLNVSTECNKKRNDNLKNGKREENSSPCRYYP